MASPARRGRTRRASTSPTSTSSASRVTPTPMSTADNRALHCFPTRRSSDLNSTWDTGDLSTTTGTDGAWSFTGLGTGHIGQKVFEVLPTGDIQTLGNAGYAVSGTSGANQSNLE